MYENLFVLKSRVINKKATITVTFIKFIFLMAAGRLFVPIFFYMKNVEKGYPLLSLPL
jgi:hypothetical protein